MNWPWNASKKKWDGPRTGIREGDVRVKAPPFDAPGQQWLDFVSIAGTINEYTHVERVWRERALRAYIEKWGTP